MTNGFQTMIDVTASSPVCIARAALAGSMLRNGNSSGSWPATSRPPLERVLRDGFFEPEGRRPLQAFDRVDAHGNARVGGRRWSRSAGSPPESRPVAGARLSMLVMADRVDGRVGVLAEARVVLGLHEHDVDAPLLLDLAHLALPLEDQAVLVGDTKHGPARVLAPSQAKRRRLDRRRTLRAADGHQDDYRKTECDDAAFISLNLLRDEGFSER